MSCRVLSTSDARYMSFLKPTTTNSAISVSPCLLRRDHFIATRSRLIPDLLGAAVAGEDASYQDQNAKQQRDDPDRQHHDGGRHPDADRDHDEADDHGGDATEQPADNIRGLMHR